MLNPGDYVTGLRFCCMFSLPANCPLTLLRAESKRRGICEVGSPYGWWGVNLCLSSRLHEPGCLLGLLVT